MSRASAANCGARNWPWLLLLRSLHSGSPRGLMTPSVSNPAPPRLTPQEARQDHDIVGAAHQIVTTLLPDGYPALQSVAELVRLSLRTLQRRSSEEGLTFAHIVTRVRFDAVSGPSAGLAATRRGR